MLGSSPEKSLHYVADEDVLRVFLLIGEHTFELTLLSGKFFGLYIEGCKCGINHLHEGGEVFGRSLAFDFAVIGVKSEVDVRLFARQILLEVFV